MQKERADLESQLAGIEDAYNSQITTEEVPEAYKKKGSHTTGSAQWDVPLGKIGDVEFSTWGDASTKGGLSGAGVTGTYNWGDDGADLGARRAGEYAVGDLPKAGPSDAALAEQFGLSEKEKRLMAMFNSAGGPIYKYGGGNVARVNPALTPIQESQGSALGALAGQVVGTAAGTAIGGPLGGKIGGSLGGQLGGQGTVDPSQTALSVGNQYKGEATDWLQDRIGFATGGKVAPKENLDDVVIQGIKWLGGALSSRNKKLTGKEPGERKKNLRPEHKMSGGSVGMDNDMVVDGKFMSSHTPDFKEKVGPLSKVVHKAEGGEVHERHYHNPLMPKPSAGGSDKK